MPLKEEMENQGHWLFKWRSYLPLLVLPLVLVALIEFENIEKNWGDLADDAVTWGFVGLSILGFLVRCAVAAHVPGATSGRNTKQQAAQSLNTSGMYSIVRHTLYLGNYLLIIGVIGYTGSMWLVLVVSLAFYIYYERIMLAEEGFLQKKFAHDYETWASEVPAFIPRISLWNPPNLPFSLRTLLKRETATLFAMVACFTLFAHLGDFLGEGHASFEPNWSIAFVITGLTWFVVRLLRKNTGVFAVAGR